MTATVALAPASFAGYPPQARGAAVRDLRLLQALPPPLLAALLRELIDLDWRFPAERREITEQLRALREMTPSERAELVEPFARLDLPGSLDGTDAAKDPTGYLEQMTARLWSAGAMPAYRAAAEAYATRMRTAVPAMRPQMPRLCVVVAGREVEREGRPPFHRLWEHGVRLTGVQPERGLETLLAAVRARASRGSTPYAHWVVDGGAAESVSGAEPAAAARARGARAGGEVAGSGLVEVSYAAMEPVRRRLLERAQQVMAAPKSGPEELRTLLAHTSPATLGMGATGADAMVERFALRLLTEGSGTQIFATTFVQWAGRECLRRVQPETLLLRFTPRQRQQGMDELLRGGASAGPDAAGSLVDAEMGAWLTWINLGRLPGAEEARFLAWWEGHGEAVLIGPGLPRGTVSHSGMGMDGVLRLLG